MTMSLIAPAAQLCAFALGCAVIHAARAHALAISRLLIATALVVAVLVLLGASLACAPGDEMSLDEITTYNAG